MERRLGQGAAMTEFIQFLIACGMFAIFWTLLTDPDQ